MPVEPFDVAALDAPDKLQRQPFEWRCERIGWTITAVLLLLAAVGLLGPGPLSHQVSTSLSGETACEGYWLARSGSPCALRILRWASTARESESVQISVPQSFLDRVTIDEVIPHPASVRARGGAVHYVLRAEGASGPLEVRYTPKHPGFAEFQLGINHESVAIAQFTLP